MSVRTRTFRNTMYVKVDKPCTLYTQVGSDQVVWSTVDHTTWSEPIWLCCLSSLVLRPLTGVGRKPNSAKNWELGLNRHYFWTLTDTHTMQNVYVHHVEYCPGFLSTTEVLFVLQWVRWSMDLALSWSLFERIQSVLQKGNLVPQFLNHNYWHGVVNGLRILTWSGHGLEPSKPVLEPPLTPAHSPSYI
jgi:hypothetical protein